MGRRASLERSATRRSEPGDGGHSPCGSRVSAIAEETARMSMSPAASWMAAILVIALRRTLSVAILSVRCIMLDGT